MLNFKLKNDIIEYEIKIDSISEDSEQVCHIFSAKGDWNEYEYPRGTKVEIIGSGPRGYDVKIVDTGVTMLETGLMKWSKTPVE